MKNTSNSAYFILGVVVSLLLTSCTPPNAPAPAQPSPLTTAQQAAALEHGKLIAAETFGLLSSNLQTALASGGVSNALPFCSMAASPLTTAVATRHGVTLRRISHRPRNPTARASATEQDILDHFGATLTPGQPLLPLVTNLLPDQATFFAPIVLTNVLCLSCHGTPEKDISEENLAIIRKHYPQDEATGFKLGDLRGAWRIDIPLARLEKSTSP